MAAEAEGVGHGGADRHLAGMVGGVVKVTLWIGRTVVDGRWGNLVTQGEAASNRFYRSGSSEEMSGHRLGRADSRFVRVIPEHRFDCGRLKFVIWDSGGA